MLCQLGCVTLPSEILQKVNAGQPLTVEEQRMYANHPTVGYELIRHIPRLEVVAEIIARQQEPYTHDEELHTAQERDQILLGAHILKVVLDFDRLVSQGMSHHDAVVELLRHADAYGIVAALQDMELEEAAAVTPEHRCWPYPITSGGFLHNPSNWCMTQRRHAGATGIHRLC
jgi:HD-GYP domain-containing protein (c-di-GMP phosphodiesterase class II)